MSLHDELNELVEFRKRKFRHYRGKSYHFQVTNGLAEEVEHLLEQLTEDEAVIRETQWLLLQGGERIEIPFEHVAAVLEAFMRVLKSIEPEQKEEVDGNATERNG